MISRSNAAGFANSAKSFLVLQHAGRRATFARFRPSTAKQEGAGALLGHIQEVARVAVTGNGVPVCLPAYDFIEVLMASAKSGDKALPEAGIALWHLARAKPQLRGTSP